MSREKAPQSASAASRKGNWRLWVGSLDARVTSETLRQHFSAYKSFIRSVVVKPTRGRPQKFAFVSFNDEAAAREAQRALDGTKLLERTIKVNIGPKGAPKDPKRVGERAGDQLEDGQDAASVVQRRLAVSGSQIVQRLLDRNVVEPLLADIPGIEISSNVSSVESESPKVVIHFRGNGSDVETALEKTEKQRGQLQWYVRSFQSQKEKKCLQKGEAELKMLARRAQVEMDMSRIANDGVLEVASMSRKSAELFEKAIDDYVDDHLPVKKNYAATEMQLEFLKKLHLEEFSRLQKTDSLKVVSSKMGLLLEGPQGKVLETSKQLDNLLKNVVEESFDIAYPERSFNAARAFFYDLQKDLSTSGNDVLVHVLPPKKSFLPPSNSKATHIVLAGLKSNVSHAKGLFNDLPNRLDRFSQSVEVSPFLRTKVRENRIALERAYCVGIDVRETDVFIYATSSERFQAAASAIKALVPNEESYACDDKSAMETLLTRHWGRVVRIAQSCKVFAECGNPIRIRGSEQKVAEFREALNSLVEEIRSRARGHDAYTHEDESVMESLCTTEWPRVVQLAQLSRVFAERDRHGERIRIRGPTKLVGEFRHALGALAVDIQSQWNVRGDQRKASSTNVFKKVPNVSAKSGADVKAENAAEAKPSNATCRSGLFNSYLPNEKATGVRVRPPTESRPTMRFGHSTAAASHTTDPLSAVAASLGHFPAARRLTSVDDDDAKAASASEPKRRPQPLRVLETFPYARGKYLEVCNGNVADDIADVIVSAASGDLEPQTDSARAILEMGGPSLETECRRHVRTNGLLSSGSVVTLSSGNLRCRHVVHVVVSGTKFDLQMSLRKCFSAVESVRAKSISLPLLFDDKSLSVEKGYEVMLEEIRSRLGAASMTCINRVRLVDSNPSLERVVASILAVPLSSQWSQDAEWQYQDDDGVFYSFNLTVAQQLEDAFTVFPKGQCQVKIDVNGVSCTVDFSAGTQRNDVTGEVTSIRRYDPNAQSQPKSKANWYFQDDHQRFCPYDATASQVLNDAFLRDNLAAKITVGAFMYQVNLTDMTQTNLTTMKVRKIKRDLVSSSDMSKKSAAMLPEPKVSSSSSSTSFGSKIRQFFSFLGDEEVTETVTISPDAGFALDQRMRDLAAKKKVELTFSCNNTKLSIRGVKSIVSEVRSGIQSMIIEYLDRGTDRAETVTEPPEWESQTERVELKQVQRWSEEATRIEELMKESMPRIQILRIDRIQNQWQWEQYEQQRERMWRKNGGVTNERLLFHGTSSTDPKCIYKGEEGFDMRFSSSGLWGQGNYFALKASYSDSYAYRLPNGLKQMFLVKVLAGDSVELKPDRSLRKAPEKGQGSGGVNFEYDSVNGITAGCRVYITYKNDKTYPFYLVTYV